MNKMKNNVGKNVSVKFKRGRVISGVLRGDIESGFTVKLGVLYIPLDPEEILWIK